MATRVGLNVVGMREIFYHSRESILHAPVVRPVAISLHQWVIPAVMCVCMYHSMYYCAGLSLDRHNSTHAPTSPSLLNSHEISYSHPTPTPLHHTQDACQSIASYKFVVNLST